MKKLTQTRLMKLLLTPVGKRLPVRGGRGAPHGVALLVVLIALSLMSAVVTDLGTNEIVRYRLASNDRDAMKAQALAESSLNIARLLLAMQDAVQPMITQLSQTGIPLPAHTFWQLVPLDSELLKGLTSGEMQSMFGMNVDAAVEERRARREAELEEKKGSFDPDKEGAGLEPFAPPEGGFGAFDGTFRADIQDEEQKPATLRGWATTISPAQCYAYAQRIFHVIEPERYDFLFEDRDGQGNRTTREELIANLYDWLDENQDAVDPRADAAAWCRGAGGSEDAGYSSGYKVVPKNAYYDAPGELRLVRGMSDAHLRAFGDKISIYGEGKVNVLSAPIGTIEALIYSCAQPGEPLLFNPSWIQETLTGWEESKTLGMLGGGFPPTPDGLIGFLDSRGLTVTPQCKDFMGTESHNFTIRAIAQVGEVTRTMTTVMRVHRATEEFYYYAVR